jgi:PadR family transcriptional regulator PadR
MLPRPQKARQLECRPSENGAQAKNYCLFTKRLLRGFVYKKDHLLTINRSKCSFLLTVKRRIAMAQTRGEVLQGTLDLIVLKTLDALGPLHGYGIAVRIQQVSADLLKLNQGTLYPALLRLEQRGWISSKWGVSDNNRKAKYYSLTRSGRKQLLAETESWERMAALMTRLLGRAEGA